MTVDIATPVTAIEGVGGQTALLLTQHRVLTVFDLLRFSSRQLHRMVRQLASEEEVVSWQTMASLLQVWEVKPQWAEALVKAGMNTIDELARQSLEEIERIMNAALAERTIPDVPSHNQIANMQKDAVLITNTGSICGSVLDEDGAPVSGVELRLGWSETTTDPQGRFRLLRIPLRSAAPLIVQAPDRLPHIVEHPDISLDIDARTLRTFSLPAVAEEGAAARLSEIGGDKLPPISGHRVRSTRLDLTGFQSGEIFIVREFLTREPDAILASKFMDYENGDFIAKTLRIPVAQLPTAVALRDHLSYRNGEFHVVRMDAARLQRRKKIQQIKKSLGPMPEAHTPRERETEFERRLARFRENGFFSGRQ